MASPGVREPHMPPVVYVQLASADVMRARANLSAAAAAYVEADVSYVSATGLTLMVSSAAAAEERLLSAASEMRYVMHVHAQHIKRVRHPQMPDRCSSCQQELSQADVDANWGRCASCL